MTTEDGSFLRRWSRRKEEARQAEADPAPPPEPEAEPGPEEAAAPFDPASLPPLESLGPDSDYTAFLRREVPRALRSAALRRAWASQPAIVAHRPLVEYDWNWNAPGYGALRPGDEAGPLIEALFGHLRAKAAPPEAAQDALEDGLGDGVGDGDAPEPKAPEAGAPEAAPPGRPTASGPPLPDDGEPEPPAVPLPMEAPPASPEPGAVEPDWPAPDEPAPGALAGGGGEATAPAPRRRHGGAAPV